MKRFEGKTAVVIGATSEGGLGEAIARDLAMSGAQVVVAGRTIERARVLAHEIGGEAAYCDICSEESVKRLLLEASEQSSTGLDIVVNAAGQAFGGRLDEVQESTLIQSALINLIGPVLAMKHASYYLANNGTFLQISSISATQPTPMSSAYSIFKTALHQALAIAAVEAAGRGIRFLGLAPGIVITPMTRFLDNENAKELIRQVTPLGRMVAIADVVAFARFLVSGDCFETGTVFPVTGGACLTRALTADEFFPR
jgi:NAD(P)-dependent dehydrogenase (short-subunit alcohol dehydrogenase family)